jgi:DinB superfamily
VRLRFAYGRRHADELVSDPLQTLLSEAFDHYAQRTIRRLAGLTDEEYFWEPVPGCWTVRGGTADWARPPPDPPPVTTIAWRLVHICSFLQEHGMRAVAFERGAAAKGVPPSVVPASAAAALVAVDAAIAAWRHDLASVDDARLWEPMGPKAGPYGNAPVASFVEHIHDEFVHHSAEVALLRDLFRASRTAQ